MDQVSVTPIVDWVKVLTGQSTEGREISFYLSKSDNLEPGPINTLVFGAFHGDEVESQVLTQRFLESTALELSGEKRVGVVPVVNPDGLSRQQRVNVNGVDLNRNFPTRDWAELNQDSLYYSGPQAASEAETQFILKLLELYPPAKIISVHTPYKVLNFDGPAEALAQAMAQENGYPVVVDIGYSTPGSFGTYVGKERNIPTITLELPEEDFDEAELQRNIRALIAGIQWSLSAQ